MKEKQKSPKTKRSSDFLMVGVRGFFRARRNRAWSSAGKTTVQVVFLHALFKSSHIFTKEKSRAVKRPPVIFGRSERIWKRQTDFCIMLKSAENPWHCLTFWVIKVLRYSYLFIVFIWTGGQTVDKQQIKKQKIGIPLRVVCRGFSMKISGRLNWMSPERVVERCQIFDKC